MKLIGDGECYSKIPKAAYGNDAYGTIVEALNGYIIIENLEDLQDGDIPFDVYAGWLIDFKINRKYHLQAINEGRWTTWARPSLIGVSS